MQKTSVAMGSKPHLVNHSRAMPLSDTAPASVDAGAAESEEEEDEQEDSETERSPRVSCPGHRVVHHALRPALCRHRGTKQ